jgi:hypothetical protein
MKRHSLRRRGSFNLSASLRAASRFEPLEGRTLLCAEHGFTTYNDPNEFTGIPEGYAGPEGGAADIIWVNRETNGNNSDTFDVFGAQADTARAAVDAVLVAFERMIGDFNYSNGSNNYNVTITTGGNHNGASAGLNTGTILNGLPKSGTVTMGRGSSGTGSGWFFDPTPNESSEFVGNITNAFSGDAQAGSPASGLGDFYTVVAAEIAHCLGLYGNTLPRLGGAHDEHEHSGYRRGRLGQHGIARVLLGLPGPEHQAPAHEQQRRLGRQQLGQRRPRGRARRQRHLPAGHRRRLHGLAGHRQRRL